MLAKLIQSGGMNAISRQLGAPPAEALGAARALLPGLLEGLRRYPGGDSALFDLFAEAGSSGFASAIMEQGSVDTAPGEAIIARIGGIALPDDDKISGAAALRLRVAPLLAMLVVGYLAARATATALTSEELALLLADDAEPNRVASEDDSV